jgi:hypothetical protein
VHVVKVMSLALAFSVALNIGGAAGLTARHAGASPAQAVLTAAGTVGTVMALFFAAVVAYQ